LRSTSTPNNLRKWPGQSVPRRDGSPLTTPEIHLFILWPYALAQSAEILNDIRGRFGICDMIELHWDQKHFERNLARFYGLYGMNLSQAAEKLEHCGLGPFLVIVVEDSSPVYAQRRTWHGVADVNVNLFDAKRKYRAWTGGGHRVHATNDPVEVNHDLFLLLGQRASAYARDGSPWNGEVRRVEANLVGTTGWRDLSELFDALDLSMKYVAIHDAEELFAPTFPNVSSRRELDILVEDPMRAAMLVNGRSVARGGNSASQRTLIGRESILVNLLSVGDRYFDPAWERALLMRRVEDASGVYVPAPRDRFYAALYDALVHRPQVTTEAASLLSRLAHEYSLPVGDYRDSAFAKGVLDRYLREAGYKYVVPRDPSVYFNAELIGRPPALARRAVLRSVRQLGNRSRRWRGRRE